MVEKLQQNGVVRANEQFQGALREGAVGEGDWGRARYYKQTSFTYVGSFRQSATDTFLSEEGILCIIKAVLPIKRHKHSQKLQ